MRTLALFAAVVVTGCGSDTTTTTDGGPDGTVPNDTGTGTDGTVTDSPVATDSGTDGGGDGGAITDGGTDSGGSLIDVAADAGCLSDWNSCESCMKTSCGTERTACIGNTACKTGYTSSGTCIATCGNNCDVPLDTAGALGQDLLDCAQNNCSACGL